MVPKGAALTFFLSKGTDCVISIFGVHHNPEVWPDPEVRHLPLSNSGTRGRGVALTWKTRSVTLLFPCPSFLGLSPCE